MKGRDTARVSAPYLVIFLVSAAAMVFQVAQTRLFSASFGYHLAYLVISVSLLGVGFGATLSALVDRGARRPGRPALALALAVSALVALIAETRVDPNRFIALAVLAAYVLGSLPFVFASWIVVRSLKEDPSRSGRLYASDLGGAAGGSLLALAGISAIGVPALYGLAAALAALAAVVAAPRAMRSVVGLALTTAALLALAGWSEQLTPPLPGPVKSEVVGPGIVHEAWRWDPQARVDVVRYTDLESSLPYQFLMDRSYASARPGALQMFLDLGASTPILDGSGDLNALRASVIAAPYALVYRPSVLVIGPGGGIDIQNALVHGARGVDAVEVNRGVVELMQGAFAGYNGDVYAGPGVRIYEDEARSFVRRSAARYDVIVMTVVDSWAALASGSYALTESYLYTEESFGDYLRHLEGSGVMAVGRWYRDPPIEMVHTAQLATQALRTQGVAEPGRHVMVLRHGNFGLLLARPSPFDATSSGAVRRFAGEHGFEVAYDPLDPKQPFADAIADLSAVPATDDRPFFFAADPSDDRIPVAQLILYLALFAAAVLSYAFLLLPVRRTVRGALGTPAARRATLEAAGLGLGFIGAEIVLLQRLTLYLGQPAVALAFGIASLLAGAACGSALATRTPLRVAGAALLSALLVTGLLGAMTWISDATLAWALPARLVIAATCVAAVGVPLGAVFPQVVARAAAQDARLVSWVWAVNGVASVIGSILAVALAMNAGFTAVGLCAAACYLFVAIASVTRVPSPISLAAAEVEQAAHQI